MQVTDIKVYPVKSYRNSGIPSPWILLQVFTDEGLVGVGDATNWPGGRIISRAVEELGSLVIGEDPFHIEYLYHRMYHALHQIGQTGAVIAAISGIEIALWDIVGKALGRPIYDLLGGPCRDRVRFYSHADQPQGCVRLAQKGCTAIKAYFPGGRPRRGERIEIPTSITLGDEMKALDHMRRCRRAVGDEVDMIMPDVVRAGGILETKKIAAMAESYYMQVSPHNPNSAVSTLASLQLMANIPNGLVLEYVDDEQDAPWRNDLLSDPPQVEDGCLLVPARPGLGTELVMKEVEKYRFEG